MTEQIPHGLLVTSPAVSTSTVPIQFVHRALQAAVRAGVDVNELLRGTGVAPDLVVHARSRVTVGQAARVARRLWRLTDDEMFGAGPHPVPRGTFRMVALGVIHSPDLRTALQRTCEFSAVLPGLPTISASMGPERTVVCLDHTGLRDPEHLVVDLMVGVVQRFTAWLVGQRIKPLALELPYPSPEDPADYDRVFGARPRFDAERAALTFDSALLAAPVIRTEAEMLDWVRNSPGDLLARRDYGSSLADQVRRIMEYPLVSAGAPVPARPVPWPAPEEVAARLNLSLQHLRRRLRAEGTSMSVIREEILRDAAVAALASGREPVTDLAIRLGFSEPSAFRRAFRRWTGTPPGSYRPR
ncbi:AraC family transcriptional regulator [Pseudonocardia eucalypti]|uniref:AraC family transcriptional regulator n=1 Tax=Pseudonocardia eucalypti TaxID=648755 RepID=A0ABP9PUT4_9PSEU